MNDFIITHGNMHASTHKHNIINNITSITVPFSACSRENRACPASRTAMSYQHQWKTMRIKCTTCNDANILATSYQGRGVITLWPTLQTFGSGNGFRKPQRLITVIHRKLAVPCYRAIQNLQYIEVIHSVSHSRLSMADSV